MHHEWALNIFKLKVLKKESLFKFTFWRFGKDLDFYLFPSLLLIFEKVQKQKNKP